MKTLITLLIPFIAEHSNVQNVYKTDDIQWYIFKFDTTDITVFEIPGIEYTIRLIDEKGYIYEATESMTYDHYFNILPPYSGYHDNFVLLKFRNVTKDNISSWSVIGDPYKLLSVNPPLNYGHGQVQSIPTIKVFCNCADFNNDGGVDNEDLLMMSNCKSRSGVPYQSGCGFADIDKDGDVDQSDFGILQKCLGD